MKDDKILITGGFGFIGLETAKLLVEQGRKVLLLDNLSPQIHGAVPDLASQSLVRHSLIEIIRDDVRESGALARILVDVNYVVHLAAETGTGQSMYEISRYTETNVSGAASLLDYLANHKHYVVKVVLSSSRAVYGEGSYRCERCGLVYPTMRSESMLRMRQWEPLCPKCQGRSAQRSRPSLRIRRQHLSMRLRNCRSSTWCVSPHKPLGCRL